MLMLTLIFVIQDNELMGIEIITWNVCVKMTGLNFIWNYRKYRRSAKQKTFKSHAHWRPKLIENEIKSKIMNEWEKRLTFYDNLWSTTIKIKTMFFFCSFIVFIYANSKFRLRNRFDSISFVRTAFGSSTNWNLHFGSYHVEISSLICIRFHNVISLLAWISNVVMNVCFCVL